MPNIDLTPAHSVGVLGLADPPLGSWENGIDQFSNHVEHVLVSGAWRAADAPQVDLVRFSDVAAVDGVASIHEPRRDDQFIDISAADVGFQRGGELRAHVAAQHGRRADVSGVAAGAGDIAPGIPEAVVVRGDRDDGRAAHVPDRAAPAAFETCDDGAQKSLDGMFTLGGIGEIPKVEGAAAPTDPDGASCICREELFEQARSFLDSFYAVGGIGEVDFPHHVPARIRGSNG